MTDKYYESKRAWAIANKDKVRARQRQQNLGGRWTGLHKREYQGTCEICGYQAAGTMQDKLGYHHWDDSTPDLGLWLCSQCHKYAEGMDKALSDPVLLQQYAALKNKAGFEHYSSRLL
ncbi:MAG: hypothetical protein WC479_11160 [Candidatus Izemoplasmatales bacterium]